MSEWKKRRSEYYKIIINNNIYNLKNNGVFLSPGVCLYIKTNYNNFLWSYYFFNFFEKKIFKWENQMTVEKVVLFINFRLERICLFFRWEIWLN